MVHLLYGIPSTAYVWGLVVLALLAWLRGGRWERLGAAMLNLNCAFSIMAQDRQHLMGPQYGYMIVDAVFFFVFAAIALRSRLWWATWAAGFLLFGIAMHVAMVVDKKVGAYAYYLGIALYTYLLIGTLIIGTLTRSPSARVRRDPKP